MEGANLERRALFRRRRPPIVEERYIYLEDVNALKEGAILVLEGATFGGHHILEKSMLNVEGAPPWAHVFARSSSKPLI